MKKSLLFLTGGAILFLAACHKQESACQWVPDMPHYLTAPPETLPSPVSESVPAPVLMEIGGKSILVDKVIEGPLCNDVWSGTVYVTCDVQVYPWEEQPTFLKSCDLSIAPGTIVYVAYHNDSAYYNGCSCHTGEIPGP